METDGITVVTIDWFCLMGKAKKPTQAAVIWALDSAGKQELRAGLAEAFFSSSI